MDKSNMGIRPPIDLSPSRELLPEPDHAKESQKNSVWNRIQHSLQQSLHNSLFGNNPVSSHQSIDQSRWTSDQDLGPKSDCSTRRIDIGISRQPTFERQISERRERLLPVEPGHAERRASSTFRCTSYSTPFARSKSSPPPVSHYRSSAPAITQNAEPITSVSRLEAIPTSVSDLDRDVEPISPFDLDAQIPSEFVRPPRPLSRTSSTDSYSDDRFHNSDDRAQLNDELDSKWILNLSMHFRDKSDREKFFLTYAEQPNRWRRVTVSCDYRNAEPDSLEMDLKELKFQRDKSLQIYKSIRDSLPDIQFYDTVTNLKLETSEGRLHVHVTEDVNEIIPYPPKSMVSHILEDSGFRPIEICESEIDFDSHLSGFVYKVTVDGKSYIKKEIPGPDTVDEFLYEINALHALHGSRYVIQLEAIVLDDSRELVKGLLISYADKGAVVDLLYDHRGEIPWEDRVRWAQQAVQGLSEIHEEGFVQGDFTLSNIVVDNKNNAQIIDINRRGCPVGWEPPEIAKKIASNQRISMYIGEKSDIYQLGMTLWALAMDDDEPERHDPPLSTEQFPADVPEWYQKIVRICLSAEPRNRLSTKELLCLLEPASSTANAPVSGIATSLSIGREPQFIDPDSAVERDDIERLTRPDPQHDNIAYTPASSSNDSYPRSSKYQLESGNSQFERPRGRRPPTNTAHLHDRSPTRREPREEHYSLIDDDDDDIDDYEPQIISISPDFQHDYEEIELDGHPYLISRSTFEMEDLEILERRYGIHASHQQAEPIGVLGTDDRRSSPAENTVVFGDDKAMEEIDLDPPMALNNISVESDGTPRNSHSVLASSISTIPSSLTLDVSSSDLAGLGGHPALGEHCPHEPQKMSPSSPSTTDEAIGAVYPSSTTPPALPFGDSGYYEPESLSEEHGSGVLALASMADQVENSKHGLETTPVPEPEGIFEIDEDTNIGPVTVQSAPGSEPSTQNTHRNEDIQPKTTAAQSLLPVVYPSTIEQNEISLTQGPG